MYYIKTYNKKFYILIFSANSYNAVAVCELLSEIVTQALKDYPANVSWLRLMGDINFGEYQTGRFE